MFRSRRTISENELQAVKDELDVAKRTIDSYAHLGMKFSVVLIQSTVSNSPLTVTQLYGELDTLRNNVCEDCKKKVVPSGVSAHRNSSGQTQPSQRVVGGPAQPPTTTQTLSISESNIHDTGTPSASSSTIVPIDPTPPPPPTPNTPIINPDWSLTYNYGMRGRLDVNVTHTIQMDSGVRCVKFSRDGRHLAVGLDAGDLYIYDTKTRSNRFILFSVLIWNLSSLQCWNQSSNRPCGKRRCQV